MTEQRPSGRPPEGMSKNARDIYIKIARSHFSDDGYDAASMSSIAKEAGYTPTALRHYFPDKADLYGAVFTATANEVYPAIVQHLYSSSMAEAIDKSISTMATIKRKTPEYPLFLNRTPSELRKHPELQEKVQLRENFQEFYYTTLITLGRKTGELNGLTDEALKLFFRTAMQGWVYESTFSMTLNLDITSALTKFVNRLEKENG